MIFSGSAARARFKICEFFRLYNENMGAAFDEIHNTLRPLMKSKRAHRTPPQDSPLG